MESNKITILAIDDEADIRYALKAIFDFAGWESVLAKNVEEGMRMLIEHKPDIVLIDYHLPVINGIIGVEMIRQVSQDIPILVLTIDESQKVANDFLLAGASDFALKPIKAPDLISRIRLHIRLLESKSDTETVNMFPKGIVQNTLDLILNFFKTEKCPDYIDISEIASGTGLAPQTVNRYLQFMVEQGMIHMQMNYGKKGRPKQVYTL